MCGILYPAHKEALNLWKEKIPMLDLYTNNSVVEKDDKNLAAQSVVTGKLYQSLVSWAASQPQATYIVEADTGREFSYAQILTAVDAMRHFLGNHPQRLLMSLPGGMLNAVLWISALSGGHHLLPISPDAPEKEKARAIKKHQPDIVFIEQEEAQTQFLSIVNASTLCDLRAMRSALRADR
jgi:hypothetical protein